MIGEHETQTFEVMIVVLFLLMSFDIFIPTNAHPLLLLNKWLVKMHLNVNSTFIERCHYELGLDIFFFEADPAKV